MISLQNRVEHSPCDGPNYDDIWFSKSTAQRQREYREKLKLRNPELLRERERRKWRQRQMKRRSALQSSTLQNIAQASCNRTNPLAEIKGREMSVHAGHSSDMDNSCPRRLHLVDETTYRNYIQQVDVAGTALQPSTLQNIGDAANNRANPLAVEMKHREMSVHAGNSSDMDVSSRLRNAEPEEIVKCFLLGLLNNWIKDKKSESLPAIASPECVRDVSRGRNKTSRTHTCEKGVMKASMIKTNKMTKTNAKTQRNKRVEPIPWDPI